MKVDDPSKRQIPPLSYELCVSAASSNNILRKRKQQGDPGKQTPIDLVLV